MSSKPKPPATTRVAAKPKAMSSKLLTMKFMQRSAASSRTETLAVREALTQENAKRDAALQARERSASTADAETRWELSYVKKIDAKAGAGVVDWGYGQLVNSEEEDEEDEDEEQRVGGGGRMVFGGFKSQAEPSKPAEDDSDEEVAPRRKDVSLRGLTSISNAGLAIAATAVCNGCGAKGHTQAKCPRAKCYACDGEGHMAMECPRPRKGQKRQPLGYSGGPKEDVKRRRSGDY